MWGIGEQSVGIWHAELGSYLEAIRIFLRLLYCCYYKPPRILWYESWSLHIANKCAIVSQNRTENKLIFKNLVWECTSFVYDCVQEYNTIKFMHILICMRKWFTTVDQCVMNILLVCNIQTSPCSLEIISVFHCNHLINCWLPANCCYMRPH